MTGKRQKITGKLLAFGVGLVGLFASFVAYVILGFVTGVIASCASAPEWWITTYFYGFYAVPVWGGYVGHYFARRFLQWYGSSVA